MFRKVNKVHFVGIGGIGMSGIAELLLNQGFKITGSDINDTPSIFALGSKVGINTSSPNNALAVVGTISSDTAVYAKTEVSGSSIIAADILNSKGTLIVIFLDCCP